MKKKIFSLLLLLLLITSTSGFALEMATLAFPADFQYYKRTHISNYFKMNYMSINQKMSFKISGTCAKPLRLKADISLVKDGNYYVHQTTVPLVRRGKRFYLNYKCLAGPGIYDITFQAAPRRGGKFHWMASTKLFCGLDPAKAGERRFYNNLGSHKPLTSGYNSSDNDFSIAPVPATVKNKVRLKITLKKAGKYHIEILKKEYGNVERKAHFPANFKKGTQEFDYFFKDGPGTYIVSFSQITIKPNGVTQTMMDPRFEVKVTNPLPLTTSSTVLSSKLVTFVKKNIGKQVGNGICGNLYSAYARGNNTEIMIMPMSAVKLFKLSPGTKLPTSVLKGFYSGNNVYEQYGQPIQAKDLMPGDLITMIDATWRERITYGKEHRWSTGGMAHGAVVYKKLGKGKFLIAHQNIGGVKKVRITGFNINRVKGLDIKYIRLVRGLVPVK